MVKTIKLDDDVHKRLQDFKIHPRETFQDMIVRAINGELHPSDPNKTGDEGDASNTQKKGWTKPE